MSFKDLGLIDPICKALDAEGYTEPTPIQRGAIPPALAGRDVLGCAQTGTGKTCAFAAPILQRLNGKNGNPRVIKALILTPTRELALQIGDSFKSYGCNLSLRSAVIFGGVGQAPQAETIKKGLDILTATPGRLLDLQGQGLLDLSHIEIFVLDEADRMLDMGFIHDVKRVLKLLPAKKQTLFFSATMPPEVMNLVNGLLHNYQRVAVDPVSSPVEVIRQSLYFVDKGNKTKLLAHLLDTKRIPSALVFSRTKHGANRIARDLEKLGVTAAAIHGNKSQTARVQALGDFKAGKLRVLVATDIAARGIDIEDLACVFNYDLPDVPETYVHRIGRTGRAGKGGTAISFCHFNEKDELKAIEKLLGKRIPVVEGHPFPMVNFDPPARDQHGRPINAEDQEAREAARELKRQREAAKAAGMTPENPAGKKKRSQKQRDGEAARQAEKQRDVKKREAAKKREPQPPAESPLEPALYSRPAHGRGERQGRLEDTLPAEPSMPAADFVKPNPLDSDVIMDATARLLSSRRGGAPRAGRERPQPAREEAERNAGRRRGQGRQAQEAPRRENAGDRARTGGPEAGSATPLPRSAPKPPRSGKSRSLPEGDRAPRSVPQPATAGHKRRDRRGGPRGVTRPLSASHQKDSTEQKSLMRPYYIEHDD